jgi:tetrahydromethanopterin S-methyltransferase subunit G
MTDKQTDPMTKKVFVAVDDYTAKILVTLTQTLETTFTQITPSWSENLKNAVLDKLDTVEDGFSNSLSHLENVEKSLKGVTTELSKSISTSFSSLEPKLTDAIHSALTEFEKTYQYVTSDVNSIKNAFATLAATPVVTKDEISQVTETIVQNVTGLSTQVVLDQIKSFITDYFNNIDDHFNKIINNFTDFNSLYSKRIDSIETKIEDVAGGLKTELIQTIAATEQSLLDNVNQKITAAEKSGLNGVSGLLHDLGADFEKNIQVVTSDVNSIKNAFATLAAKPVLTQDDISQVTETIIQKATASATQAILDQVKSFITDSFNAINEQSNKIINNLSEFNSLYSKRLDAIEKKLEDISSGLKTEVIQKIAASEQSLLDGVAQKITTSEKSSLKDLASKISDSEAKTVDSLSQSVSALEAKLAQTEETILAINNEILNVTKRSALPWYKRLFTKNVKV